MLQLKEALKECFNQVRFARAAELARSGRFLEAEGVLAPNGRASSNPKELDLLARISAQQRRYVEARRLWEIALEAAPGNTDYQRAIERTREAEQFQRSVQRGAMIVLAALAAAASFMILWGQFRRPKPPASDAVAQPKPHVQAGSPSRPALQPTPSPQPEQRQQAIALPATPAPAEQLRAPATPQPVPTTTQPAPATPPPPPATPPPPPATPQPAPANPQPTPTTPQPAPVPQFEPTTPQPAPAAPQIVPATPPPKTPESEPLSQQEKPSPPALPNQ